MIETLQTASRQVDFQAILNYADVTNDYNPIHVDKEFAAKSPMGGVIAHGTMSLAHRTNKADLEVNAIHEIGAQGLAQGLPDQRQ